jgi:flagellar assembly factor FliW
MMPLVAVLSWRGLQDLPNRLGEGGLICRPKEVLARNCCDMAHSGVVASRLLWVMQVQVADIRNMSMSTSTVTTTSTHGTDSQRAFAGLKLGPESIFSFPQGIPAFEDIHEFVFVMSPSTQPFIQMRALSDLPLSFVCVDPFIIHDDYHPTIPESELAAIEVENPEDLLLLSIVSVSDDAQEFTANLRGPLAINMRTRRGRQVICSNDEYAVRHRMWEALEGIESTDGEDAQDAA